MFSFARFVTSVYYLTRFKLKPPAQRLSESEVGPLVLWGGGWACAQEVKTKILRTPVKFAVNLTG